MYSSFVHCIGMTSRHNNSNNNVFSLVFVRARCVNRTFNVSNWGIHESPVTYLQYGVTQVDLIACFLVYETYLLTTETTLRVNLTHDQGRYI